MASINGQGAAAVVAPGLQKLAANSSFIGAFEYDPNNLTLTTHLKSGAIYQHKFFLLSEWISLKTAQNHSKHWADNIRGKKISVRVKSAKAPNSAIRLGGRKG